MLSTTSLSEALIKARISKRLSQTEVAEFVGVSQSSYNNWESGRHCPSLRHFSKLCEILGLSSPDLLRISA
ncbi:DNA-binding transcriptional regulator, XRE-family HTH domain [Pseudarcicella hirudinis]|uniref:DNA-binding transcriptional regulator, XRE-family HTH domain n=1 Tax=Pseudarcicella hirudinis TaxID=1079859 RepID=A0A1I5QIM9_9BACT|nr:helix-turn-helix transcriptional regulator [Pseudarcicella hirudinis]SFP45967.1 DNA-binding transcriptional regulator, XRE-family HTH domain [Pseudarcicella hirudinis]